ncbi:Thiosulfate sulfurtransferase RDL1, mitochondrial [Wickerhamiella sorbophila]|uniref:Thiosulfate sulfurtransferase RDL1, mitochondrial n=1 Tax=Wickerhamiella sorbophila TaxID=45607 RepID=A0A2T0FP33_9ASCO|nr:Thiosulfate sulfurtransferase RDL1, mitochondrial [Wickerhamiella sorbophila]PRT56751.1 Thiosulfate sulfurtransferase RDL1, mitochondrial [Wickerhamiella sorbophila]
MHGATLAPMTLSFLQIAMVAAGLLFLRAMFSSFSDPTNGALKLIDFTGVQEILNAPSPEYVIIDVRERSEFRGGHIPNAVNMPFFASPGALGLDEQEFEKKVGFKKPSLEQKLLFYCRSGTRSKRAAAKAFSYGYENVSNYPGSYQDWVSHGGRTEK